jgi:xanthine/uracil permease
MTTITPSPTPHSSTPTPTTSLSTPTTVGISLLLIGIIISGICTILLYKSRYIKQKIAQFNRYFLPLWFGILLLIIGIVLITNRITIERTS